MAAVLKVTALEVTTAARVTGTADQPVIVMLRAGALRSSHGFTIAQARELAVELTKSISRALQEESRRR